MALETEAGCAAKAKRPQQDVRKLIGGEWPLCGLGANSRFQYRALPTLGQSVGARRTFRQRKRGQRVDGRRGRGDRAWRRTGATLRWQWQFVKKGRTGDALRFAIGRNQIFGSFVTASLQFVLADAIAATSDATPPALRRRLLGAAHHMRRHPTMSLPCRALSGPLRSSQS